MLDAAPRELLDVEQELEHKMRWYQPVFPKPLEQEFLRQGGATWLRVTRNWMLETLCLGTLMVWGAVLSGRDAVIAVLLLQVLASLPVVLAIVLLPRLPPGWARETLFGGVALIVVSAIAVQGWWMSAVYANRYVMGSGLALFSILLVVPLRLKQCAILCVLGLIVLPPITLLSPNPGQRASWDLLVFTGLSLPLGLRVRSGAEGDQRKLFLLRRREDVRRGALARANERLRELSEMDPLTGIANRRSFDAALRQHMSAAVDTRPSLLLLDVDHFKRFNDTYGHPQGDDCLRLVAGALRAQVRGSSDLVARIGGEEFAVLLPHATELDATEVAERVRLAVEVLQLPHRGRPDQPPFVTISVGGARASVADTVGTLIARADKALYAAKANGRNQAFLAWAAFEQPGARAGEAANKGDSARAAVTSLSQ